MRYTRRYSHLTLLLTLTLHKRVLWEFIVQLHTCVTQKNCFRIIRVLTSGLVVIRRVSDVCWPSLSPRNPSTIAKVYAPQSEIVRWGCSQSEFQATHFLFLQ